MVFELVDWVDQEDGPENDPAKDANKEQSDFE